jgi:hypothetical protein
LLYPEDIMEQEPIYQDVAMPDVLSPCWDGPLHNTSLQDPVQQEPSFSVFGLPSLFAAKATNPVSISFAVVVFRGRSDIF